MRHAAHFSSLDAALPQVRRTHDVHGEANVVRSCTTLSNLSSREKKAGHELLLSRLHSLALTLFVAQLVDLEWKFGVTASSSELDQVGQRA